LTRRVAAVVLLARNIVCYIIFVIESFRHRGVEKFFKTGVKSGILPKHEARLRIQLTTLNLASNPLDMNREGWGWHPLKGKLKGHWAVTVNGNWRLSFTLEGEDAILVDYQDYH
jgi:toxin HigB-1